MISQGEDHFDYFSPCDFQSAEYFLHRTSECKLNHSLYRYVSVVKDSLSGDHIDLDL